jgi:hypothetical protein
MEKNLPPRPIGVMTHCPYLNTASRLRAMIARTELRARENLREKEITRRLQDLRGADINPLSMKNLHDFPTVDGSRGISGAALSVC